MQQQYAPPPHNVVPAPAFHLSTSRQVTQQQTCSIVPGPQPSQQNKQLAPEAKVNQQTQSNDNTPIIPQKKKESDKDKEDVSEDEISKWIATNLPDSDIKSVSGNGACLLEALSYILWQTTEHYKILGKAISKHILDNYEKLETETGDFCYPLTRLCRKISDFIYITYLPT